MLPARTAVDADLNRPDGSQAFLETLGAVRDVVRAAMPCRELILQETVEEIFSERCAPINSQIVSCFARSEYAIRVGAALDLIGFSLQRLHALNDDDRLSALVPTDAARVLVGDYLTSGAFILISSCPDFDVLRCIGAAMSTTCELETCRSAASSGDASRFGVLGQCAGTVASLLAGADDSAKSTAEAFGRHLAIAHEPSRGAVAPVGRAPAMDAARERTFEHARRLLASTGNLRPLALANTLLGDHRAG